MAFNTAIFYDIENLLRGYSFSQQLITNVSLTDILESVEKTARIGDIAVQRAYANWSDPRLAIMRGEINQLGIDPIQVFGFSRDQKKNAADIQLAIDAIDLAHVRPAISIFVIVSGDGGFASLAKKLHEYGKLVIGCAYKDATNQVFRAVCDEFVWISDPEDDDHSENNNPSTSKGNPSEVTDPRVVRMTTRIKKLSGSSTPEGVLAKTKEVLSWFATDPESRQSLMRNGILLSVIREGLKYAVPNFQPGKLGFLKFVEYLQFACKEMDVCVARLPRSEVCLRLRSSLSSGTELLPDLEMPEIHSVDNYRSFLAAGSPNLPLPTPDALREVAIWIAEHPLIQSDIGNVIEQATMFLGDRVPLGATKFALLCFVSADVFVRTPENVALSEQKLTLRSDRQSPDAILQQLYVTARTKIADSIGEIHEDILRRLCPSSL